MSLIIYTFDTISNHNNASTHHLILCFTATLMDDLSAAPFVIHSKYLYEHDKVYLITQIISIFPPRKTQYIVAQTQRWELYIYNNYSSFSFNYVTLMLTNFAVSSSLIMSNTNASTKCHIQWVKIAFFFCSNGHRNTLVKYVNLILFSKNKQKMYPIILLPNIFFSGHI